MVVAFSTALACLTASAQTSGNSHPTKLAQAYQPMAAGYVGSQECALCHPDIYEKYSRTQMGRSMTPATPASLAGVPTLASFFDQRLNRHFELFVRDGSVYESEYEMTAEAKEVFRDTRKLDWIIGAGQNAIGALVRKGDYVFEAPLSFYSNVRQWALSPGYEYADFGFTRPILPACIACHSGRPQPIVNGHGKFRDPAFRELAVGCENCHGPGEAHIAAASTDTIVNPAKLSGWLADNICLRCHQTGDARVLREGKDYGDFRPGAPLSETLSVYMVPFGPQSPPRDDLLEHVLSMRLSKCYRSREGRLKCITCHDPHVQPTKAEAPAYFREKCLTCHSEQSCKLPLTQRHAQNPPDDCTGCHMPKRDVKVISHAVLTNHRIVATTNESFPDSAFHMTTPELPDLVDLTSGLGEQEKPSLLTMLKAYRQVMLSHPEYRERYWKMAKQLEASEPNNVLVMEALADLALQQKTLQGVMTAIEYLDRARKLGSTEPSDFEQLAKMLLAIHQEKRAVEVLREGIALIPYDQNLYQLSLTSFSSLKQPSEACKVAASAGALFPQNDSFRIVMGQCAGK
ncbi:MAG TPA: hypothetical protein VJT08_15335 [Terriglobales bacterium]|nr:hypothetical protein [Terriglobales bacterium]